MGPAILNLELIVVEVPPTLQPEIPTEGSISEDKGGERGKSDFRDTMKCIIKLSRALWLARR